MAQLAPLKVIRGMPFLKRGMRVFCLANQRWGKITSANAYANLNIVFDGEKHSRNCHPKWMIQYFNDDGALIAEYKE